MASDLLKSHYISRPATVPRGVNDNDLELDFVDDPNIGDVWKETQREKREHLRPPNVES